MQEKQIGILTQMLFSLDNSNNSKLEGQSKCSKNNGVAASINKREKDPKTNETQVKSNKSKAPKT